ncbi:recombination mediator RecR [Candidatus Raskinella chloraquaticus]|uniref:Recombination protein RecR n=1 Tax=Candidatus Raskinella chloraquaticus TaxID=1951219 RepID=A0A1W9HPX5_9HYPH|nr:MAG: recombination protein RecR [Proteobacteria bacterium SG_bin8]
MIRYSAGPEIDRLIQLLARLPGLGPRSARRAALALIKRREQLLDPLAVACRDVAEKIIVCRTCGNVDTLDPCSICRDPQRQGGMLIIVEDVADLWAMERAAAAGARYHVLGGTLSALDGVTPDRLHLAVLPGRIIDEKIDEVVLALNATVEGQTTAHYITDLLAATGVKVTRLAHGVPVGGELDYLDEGTLTTALRARLPF